MRLNTVRECYLISEYIKDNLEHFTLPLFVLHSVDDTVTDPYKTIEFYRQHPNEKKKIYLTHDANHILTLGIDDNDGRPIDILNMMVDFIDSFYVSNLPIMLEDIAEPKKNHPYLNDKECKEEIE